jgi:Outer membrane protein beta-barrel domain
MLFLNLNYITSLSFIIRFLIITFFLVLINIVVTPAQEALKSIEYPKAVFGIKGGVNISTFSASINSETQAKPGMALGIYIRKQISPKLYFRPEMYYSNQGQKDNYLYPYGGPSIGSTTTSMHYLNIPLLFELGNKVSFQFGGQLGVLLAGTEKGTVASVEIDQKLDDVMSAVDFALVAGVGITFGRNINGGVRVNYGITNILNPEQDANSNIELPNVHNRVLQFYVGYSF